MPIYNDVAQIITLNNTMSVYYHDNLSFGDSTKGIVTTSINSYNNYSTCSAVDYEDRIVVGGYGWEDCSGNNNFLLCRYNPDGSLDETFGCDGGKVSTDIKDNDNDDYANALVIDSQNRIIVCGYTEEYYDKITVVRYKANGRIDCSFGCDGAVVVSIRNSNNSRGLALTLDSYDRILVCGYTETCDDTNFAIIRLTNSGNIDYNFGDCGKVETDIRYDISGIDISGNDDFATGIAIDSQDRIIISGVTLNNNNSTELSNGADFVIVRYTDCGHLDTTFGPQQSGMVVTDISNNSWDMASFSSIAKTTIGIDSKDRIILGGNTFSLSETLMDFAVVRYDSSGNIDHTFGNNGIQITDINCGNWDVANAMVIDDQDRIVLVGYTTEPYFIGEYDISENDISGNFAIIRYDVNGNLDTSFGHCGTGIVETDVTSDGAKATSVSIDSHNKLVVGGYGYKCDENRFVVTRYHDNGLLDTEDRFYNKISIDGGSTWKAINHYRKFRSMNYKNLLLIPNINTELTQYEITLKTTNCTVSNTIILSNDIQQQNENTQATNSIITQSSLPPQRLGGVINYLL
jgi:uncharacterized delta-60 repeat protein